MPIISDDGVVIEALISNEEQRLVVVQDGTPIEVTVDHQSIDVVVENTLQEVRAVIQEHPVTETRVVAPTSLPGRSAYDIAVSNGFVGTEAEWIASTEASATAADGYRALARLAADEAAASLAALENLVIDGTGIGGQPVEITNLSDGDLARFNGMAWVNVNQRNITDGGNF